MEVSTHRHCPGKIQGGRDRVRRPVVSLPLRCESCFGLPCCNRKHQGRQGHFRWKHDHDAGNPDVAGQGKDDGSENHRIHPGNQAGTHLVQKKDSCPVRIPRPFRRECGWTRSRGLEVFRPASGRTVLGRIGDSGRSAERPILHPPREEQG